jgi:AcrR family transcriptional regulator
MSTWSAIPEQSVGLRERKKARTRAAIQDAALRLYLEQGYDATTVEQIADAAEVSPSTFFRYFPTKAETALYDRLDPVFLQSFVEQPADLSPTAALRAAMWDVLSRLAPEESELEQARWRLVAGVPELRAALAERIAPLGQMVAEALGKRIGRRPDDLTVRVWTGAVVGGLMAAVFAALQDGGDVMEYVDRSISQLEEHGLQL